jgi:hypothetical protein
VSNNFTSHFSANDAALLLIDFQPQMFMGVESHDRNAIKNNLQIIAKSAKLSNVPTVLSTVTPETFAGPFVPEVTEGVFPGHEVVARTSMTMRKCLLVIAAIAGLPSISTLAVAQSREAMSIADNDSIFVDGRSFKILPGKANGDVSTVITKLGARELGPAAIVFRKGGKLYMTTVQEYSGDGRDHGSDRRDYGSDRDESPSTAQSEREWREWQESLRQDRNRRNSRGDRRDYGSDRRDYGSDRRDYGSDRDENPSTAQSEREWREWQDSLRPNRNRRDSRNDRRDYGSDRRDYGSDRDESPSTAQSEREWREWRDSLRQNRNRPDSRNDRRDYGSDRYAAYASGRVGYGSSNQSDCASDRRYCGTDQRSYGSDRRDHDSDLYPGELGQTRLYVTDPDYAEYRLRKFFDENWTTSEAR